MRRILILFLISVLFFNLYINNDSAIGSIQDTEDLPIIQYDHEYIYDTSPDYSIWINISETIKRNDNLIYIQISWGDGLINYHFVNESTEEVYHHLYKYAGNYNIIISAKNEKGIYNITEFSIFLPITHKHQNEKNSSLDVLTLVLISITSTFLLSVVIIIIIIVLKRIRRDS